MKFGLYLAAVLTLGGAMYAGDKWSRVDFGSLTAAQAEKILNDSPWAKQAQATILTPKREPGPDDVPMPQPANVPPPGPSYKSDGYGVDDGHWDGGVGRIRSYKAPTVPVLVRWDSAVPVREALLSSKDRELRDTANTVTQPEKDYILTVIGLVPARREQARVDDDGLGRPAESDADRRADITRLRQGVLDSTRLLRPGKKPIAPEDVHLDDATGVLQIFFPKTDPIVPGDKEVAFSTQYGTLRLSEVFRLKDMLVQGRLEL